jgi:tetratricopeptide (TPR) repeat protein
LASARQIAKLLTEEVRLSEIIRSVSEIWPMFGSAPGSSQSLEVEQPGGRTDKHGQFVFEVDHGRHDPDALFQQAQAAEENGGFAEAERLYRILMKSDPTDASAAFNLGNLLRSRGRNVEAEAALRTATDVDPTFAEAWYNLTLRKYSPEPIRAL